ncbi:aspartate aminotransferase family protein [Salibacterium salarium]|uniref:Aspartate aminotransferase family protein n=1 Tax=Salibacterium salarium TaxID=284579 RepID=A0A428MUA4_9BACI|nr:aspartate aminotransferase family protein [Salibacterium salarium]RSL29724.1 aspartate aminotransferase family protein [Salibacterium salarium]
MITLENLRNNVNAYESFFLHQGEGGINAFKKQVELVSQKLHKVMTEADGPFIGKRPEDIKNEIQPMMEVTKETQSLKEVLDSMEGPILKNSLHISHEKSMAHLHCPPLLSGIIAEMIIGALNQSMDSWDQSTAATYVEEEIVKKVVEKAKLPDTADGVFTSGGTQSNYMGLLLARDYFCQTYWNQSVQQHGLPEGFDRLRIICSEEAHFTVKKSAAHLGLGEQAVVTINTDAHHRMEVEDVKQTLAQMETDNLLPFAIVATCGTTDFGSIDFLPELAEVSEEHNIWFHVDAAFGGGLLFSHSHNEKVNGLQLADSITIDFHKLLYQPISCGLFLVKDQNSFHYLSHHADYLNPVRDEEEGIVNLVNKSVQTTRRFDALKFFLTIKTLGTNLLGSMIDDTLELARETANYLRGLESFFVQNVDPEMNTVVFRFEPKTPIPMDGNDLNRSIQQQLLYQGIAVVAKTSFNGDTYLKFTLLNPTTTFSDVKEVIHDIEEMGNQLVSGGVKC